MSGAAAPEAPAPPEPRRYDLFVRHRDGLFLKLTDNGIVPGPEKLSYPIDGRWGFRPYADIEQVNLSSAHVPRSGPLAQCLIRFRNGAFLSTSSASANGTPDPAQLETFRDFIEDFHQRLVASGTAGRIIFTRGASELRNRILIGVMIVATLFFVVLPLFLTIIVRSWEPLEISLFGALFLWPAWETAQKNQPGTYDPRYPPDLVG